MPIAHRPSPIAHRIRGTATRLTLLLGGVAASWFAMADTPLPFNQTWGNHVTSGCDVQWVNGVCEEGLNGIGLPDSLKTVVLASDPNVFGVKIEPGDTLPNGYSRTFDVAGHAGDAFEINVPVVAVDGEVDFAVHVVFRDAKGMTLSTSTRVATVDKVHQLGVQVPIPQFAKTAEVMHGAIKGATPTTAVVVGMMMGVPKIPTHKVTTGPFPQYCPIFPPCSCNISCQPGMRLEEHCIITGPPWCTIDSACYCVPESGVPEYLDSTGWL